MMLHKYNSPSQCNLCTWTARKALHRGSTLTSHASYNGNACLAGLAAAALPCLRITRSVTDGKQRPSQPWCPYKRRQLTAGGNKPQLVRHASSSCWVCCMHSLCCCLCAAAQPAGNCSCCCLHPRQLLLYWLRSQQLPFVQRAAARTAPCQAAAPMPCQQLSTDLCATRRTRLQQQQ